jgi:riboflavin synthase
MFTGIVEEVGTVQAIKKGAQSSVLTIQGKVIFEDMHLGDSICVNGVCLTVTGFGKERFTADVMHESLNRSSLGSLSIGSLVNLERAMSAMGRFGGHIVSGHIDGTGTIGKIQRDDNAILYTIQAKEEILKYIVEKGSVAIDGISLTVVSVTAKDFLVSIIPHTQKATSLFGKNVGDIVNLENDIVGKYIERLMFFQGDDGGKKDTGGISMELLTKFGYT